MSDPIREEKDCPLRNRVLSFAAHGDGLYETNLNHYAPAGSSVWIAFFAAVEDDFKY